jgi:catechol 2,3-dioxygenase-like lactoylglutathione lyase family enzyme
MYLIWKGVSRFIRKRWDSTRFARSITRTLPSFFSETAKPVFTLELTYLKDRTERYDLGEGEYHLAFTAEDMAASRKKHEQMGVVAFVNEAMGIYFIEDPDGYWIEIIRKKSAERQRRGNGSIRGFLANFDRLFA